MIRDTARKRLLEIFDFVPDIKEILLSQEPLSRKRRRYYRALDHRLTRTVAEDPDIPALDWVLRRDAILVLRRIARTRNERLAGFNFLEYIDTLINIGPGKLFKSQKEGSFVEPSRGFIKEIEHLILGAVGQSGVYAHRKPAFPKYHGIKAARLRSADLSTMARNAQKITAELPSGLDAETKRKRIRNRKRILAVLGATEKDWGDWKWHIKHIVRDERNLASLTAVTESDREAVRLARENRIPFGITPYYLSLMDNDTSRKKDYSVRAQVLPSLNYIDKMKKHRDCDERSMDFMLERDTSPIQGITRRYPMILILKPILTCPQICVYCQRNWEIEDVLAARTILDKDKLEAAFQWIAETREIREVLITGGDPFLLPDHRIEWMLSRLSKIDHIERIRLGTRTLVTLPQRITDSLAKIIEKHHVPGQREIVIITHFEHAYEITDEAIEAVQRLRRLGLTVYNQLVFTFFNSRRFEAAHLRNQLSLIGVIPYYTFNTKGKEETEEFQVPIARLLQEQQEEARLFPGTVRTDEIVFNVPRLGKNYLRASQHHNVISILPDGRRVYEFHPWEKKLSLVDTYIYTDVSIYDYLKRLKDWGEETGAYKTIWYYY